MNEFDNVNNYQEPNAEQAQAAEPVENANVEGETVVEAAPAKKKSPLGLIIGGAIALGVILITLIITLICLNSPKVLARNSIVGAIKGFSERDEIAPIVDVLTQGSISASYANKEEGIEAEGKVYFGKEEIMLDGIKIITSDTEITGGAYISRDYAYVTSDELLDGEVYGVIKGEMADAYEDSIFKYNSGSKYELFDKDQHNVLTESFWAYDEGVIDDFEKDSTKISERYTKKLIKLFEKHAEYEVETKKVKVGGKSTSVRLVTITVDEEALQNIMEDLHKYVEKDRDLKNYILEYAECFEQTLKYADIMPEDMDISDLEDAYDDFLDEWEDSIDDMELDEDIEIELAMSKTSSKLYKLTVNNGSYEVVSIDLSKKGAKKSERIGVTVGGSDEYVYEIKENNSKEFEAVLEMDDEEVAALTIDKKDDEYSLDIGDGYVNVKGDFIEKSGAYTITVEKVKTGDETVDDFGDIEIVLDTKDKMPKPVSKGKVENVCSLTENDVDAIVETAEKMFGGSKHEAPTEEEFN